MRAWKEGRRVAEGEWVLYVRCEHCADRAGCDNCDCGGGVPGGSSRKAKAGGGVKGNATQKSAAKTVKSPVKV